MDSSTKSAIKSLVLTLRHTLEDELTLALKRYGIFTDQKWTPDAPPDRLTDAAEREAWRRIVTVIRRGTQEGRTLPQASADYVREAAFTLLNRLVGLKCLEVRGIIPEIITTRDIYSGRSQAHRDYRDARLRAPHPSEARAADDALPAAIQDACRQVNADLIGYLFDPDDDYSLLWPRYAVLKDCIARINALDEAVWREDEIIGWLYQFYNAEEKVAVRRRGKPQTPHDVAVINQFFTPRWVVKFLVDNTLGRLWLEMHPDSERVRAKCDYLVPEVASSSVAGSKVASNKVASNKVASNKVASSKVTSSSEKGNAPPATLLPATSATPATCYLLPDSPINNPAAPPRRPAKPVTAIRLLDPACGTMHFGHYACEVFAEMYRDSLEHGWPITGSSVTSSSVAGSKVASSKVAGSKVAGSKVAGSKVAGSKVAGSKVAGSKVAGSKVAGSKVAGSKVASNIGQDGSLLPATCYLSPATCYLLPDTIPSLILQHNLFGVDIDRRAVQLAALSLFMKARTLHPEAQVRQVNLVSADATLPDSGVREQFLARYKDAPRVQQAFAQVLADMDHVAQVGSLLRVEERLRALLTEAGYALSETGELRPRPQRAIPGLEAPVRQLGLGEQPGAGSGWTPGYTLAGLRDDLRAFARDALHEHDLNAQLFAAEADKAVHLLDVLMGEYDVVVMNPPYGETNQVGRSYLQALFPNTHGDLYGVFFEQALNLVGVGGYVGALTSSTFLYLSSFEDLRKRILLPDSHIVAALDLGMGILDDATVNTAATVLEKSNERELQSIFIRLYQYGDLREVQFIQSLENITENHKSEDVFVALQSRFKSLPGKQLAYWVPPIFVSMFEILPTLDPSFASVRNGIKTGADKIFAKFWWEIPYAHIGSDKKWGRFANGGTYSKYYEDIEAVVLWDRNAEAITSYTNEKGQNNSRIRPENKDVYFHPGITYQYISSKGFNAKILPEGSLFGVAGSSIFPNGNVDSFELLGLLNSSVIQFFLNVFVPSRVYQVSYVRVIPVSQKLLTSTQRAIADLSQKSHAIKSAWDTGNELCTRFTEPWLLQIARQVTGSKEQETGIAQILALLGESPTSQTSLLPAPPATGYLLPLLPAPPATLLLAPLLDAARTIEKAADARLQALQTEIDEAVYDLYEITPADRALIERELGDRPPEVVWPQMEGKSDAEKRREHVRRLFSYYALQSTRASDDGIVPLTGCAARAPYLVERVRALLEAEFGSQAAYQLEQDAAATLGRPLEDWLHGAAFRDFHVKLYKNRPILWRLASPKGRFAVLLDYHRLTRDTLPKVRTHYLWPQMESARTRLAAAKAHEASPKAIGDLEDELADLAACDAALESVIQGAVEVTLPEWAIGPYRNGQAPYNPELDDGVAVNILPVQAAGLVGGKVVK